MAKRFIRIGVERILAGLLDLSLALDYGANDVRQGKKILILFADVYAKFTLRLTGRMPAKIFL